MLLCEFCCGLGTDGKKGAKSRRTVLRDILTLRERRLLRMCRKRLEGGLERERVLRLRNCEGNLPIHPSAGMEEKRKKERWKERLCRKKSHITRMETYHR